MKKKQLAEAAVENNPKQEEHTMSETTETTSTEATKRTRKFATAIEGTVLTITNNESNEVKSYDFASLPTDIQAKLGPFGLASKLSNASAGKSGAEAVAAMDTVFGSLEKGEWSSRAPAEKKVTMSDLKDRLAGLSEKEQEAAKALFAKFGMNV